MTEGYCLDTSALVDGWVRSYPPDIFPDLWEKIDNLIQARLVFSPDEVLYELSKQDDSLYAWVKARPELFVPLTTEVQLAVTKILGECPRLIDSKHNRSCHILLIYF